VTETPEKASIVVSLTVVTTDESEASRAAEVMSRAGAGLALEGTSVSLTMGTVEAGEVEG
jgi:hypothetical protein